MSDGTPRWIAPIARAGAVVVPTLGRTWRIEYAAGYESLDAEIRAGRRCIYAFWHARLFPLVVTHRRRDIAVLVSRHRDGEWIARIIEALGFHTARGSSTRGGETGLREMLAFAERGHLLGITPDGPRGPERRVKDGLVYLARRTGWPVVPVATAADRAWTFDSWDRFRIPKPGARVRIAYGEPITVTADPDDLAAVEADRLRLETGLERLTCETRAAVGEPDGHPRTGETRAAAREAK